MDKSQQNTKDGKDRTKITYDLIGFQYPSSCPYGDEKDGNRNKKQASSLPRTIFSTTHTIPSCSLSAGQYELVILRGGLRSLEDVEAHELTSLLRHANDHHCCAPCKLRQQRSSHHDLIVTCAIRYF